jgi:hypothetical protein
MQGIKSRPPIISCFNRRLQCMVNSKTNALATSITVSAAAAPNTGVPTQQPLNNHLTTTKVVCNVPDRPCLLSCPLIPETSMNPTTWLTAGMCCYMMDTTLQAINRGSRPGRPCWTALTTQPTAASAGVHHIAGMLP